MGSRTVRHLTTALVVICGVLAGIASSLWMVRHGPLAETVRVGPWQAQLAAGSAGASLYARARVALVGLLALSRSETLYFVASEDDAGRPLRGDCAYDVSGGDMPARWWSITAYGADYYLIDNPARRFSYNGANLRRDAGGAFHIRLGPSEQPGNWLPTPASGPFHLTLRLYNPDPSLAGEPQALQAPRIAALGACIGG